MKISLIEARDLSEAWFLCLRKTLTEGYEYKIERGSYKGQYRKELDLTAVQVKNPATKPLIPSVPQGVPPPTSMEYVESYLPYLMTAHKAKEEQYTYGQYLEKQIPQVIKMYKEDG
ncbi:MAG: thymidylate synthase, partial [Dehalococcoidia bacterium]